MKRFLALSLPLLWGAVAPALACTCSGVPSIEDHVNERDLIIAGVVESVEPDPQSAFNNLVTFTVTHAWVGATEQQVQVATPNNEAACGFPFTQGQKYLVFADEVHLDESFSGLFTHLCLDNTPFEYAEEKIEELDALTPVERHTWSGIKVLFGLDP